MRYTTYPAPAPMPHTPPPPPPNVFDQSAGNLSAASAGAQSAASYNPMLLSGTQATYNPATVGGSDLSPYFNPYTQNVIDSSLDDLAREQSRTMNTLDAQASSAGAFGGDRHGIAMGETAGQYADAAGDLSAGLHQQNYANAQGMALADAGMINQAGQFNAGSANQFALADQNATQNAASINTNAAGTLGALSNLGFSMGMDVQNQQAQDGAQVTAMNQALIDASKQQYGGYTGWPYYSSGQQQQGVGSVPYGTSTTSEQTSQPGVLDLLSLGLLF